MLYRSLHERILKRFRDLSIYPAHHGRPMGFETDPIVADLGKLRSTLDLLRLDEEQFVSEIVRGLQPKPPNFQRVIAVNEGKETLEGIDPLDLEAGPNRCAAG